MTGIKVNVTGAQISVECAGPLTGGMVGVPVSFTFDGAWDALAKTAIFRAGGLSMAVLGVGTTATVPWEVLEKTGCTLYVGVYGLSADGAVAIPTIWAEVGVIQPGADPSADESADPSLPVWAQVLENGHEAAAEALQQAKAYTDSTRVFQSEKNGSYHALSGDEKEYLNPAMVAGVEYRTVKRFMNLPVYTMLVAATAPGTKGSLIGKKFMSNVSHIVSTQVCEVCRADGTRFSDSGVLRIFSRIDNDGNGHVMVELPSGTVGTAYNNAEVYVIMAYTKK